MAENIIIDGVDVSGCTDFDKETGHCLTGFRTDEQPFCNCFTCSYKKYKAKEQECERLAKGYSELTEIVSPYMDDFTGYNEELGGFDIVLCVKEFMEQLEAYKMEAEEGKEINAELKAENEDLKKSILQECPNCGEEYLNYKGVELYYENNDLKQTLTEIKEIAENGKRFAERYMITGEQKANVLTYANAILQKTSEVEDE